MLIYAMLNEKNAAPIYYFNWQGCVQWTSATNGRVSQWKSATNGRVSQSLESSDDILNEPGKP